MTYPQTDFAVFNERGILVKTFNDETCATSYAQHRTAILGPLTVARLVITREDIQTYVAE